MKCSLHGNFEMSGSILPTSLHLLTACLVISCGMDSCELGKIEILSVWKLCHHWQHLQCCHNDDLYSSWVIVSTSVIGDKVANINLNFRWLSPLNVCLKTRLWNVAFRFPLLVMSPTIPARGLEYWTFSYPESMFVNNNFRAWILIISWQHSYQSIKNHVTKSLLIKMDMDSITIK